MDTKLTFIGIVRSPYKTLEECPKEVTPDAAECQIKIMPPFLPALSRLKLGQELYILTWLHLADRSVLACHPRGDENRPKRGVFATRSPDRPNPIGLHKVTLTDLVDNLLTVRSMEVVDGTPVLDIKSAPPLYEPNPSGDPVHEILAAAHAAWHRGLLSGFNGNLSIRREDTIVITSTGAAKGFLTQADLSTIQLSTSLHLSGPPPSTESLMHLEIYRAQPLAKAVCHTHPPHLLALSLTGATLLDLPLFECAAFAQELTQVEGFPPGSQELAQAVAAATTGARAVFMNSHGLTCWADTPARAVAFSEELDNLARIQLLANAISPDRALS
jgi:L-fuculose-phosphate aldolase